jgi:hypothetical protein
MAGALTDARREAAERDIAPNGSGTGSKTTAETDELSEHSSRRHCGKQGGSRRTPALAPSDLRVAGTAQRLKVGQVVTARAARAEAIAVVNVHGLGTAALTDRMAAQLAWRTFLHFQS